MWTMGPKIKWCAILFLSTSLDVKIPDLGRLKRGPLGPQSSIEEASCGCAWCYIIINGQLPVAGTMYICT